MTRDNQILQAIIRDLHDGEFNTARARIDEIKSDLVRTEAWDHFWHCYNGINNA